MLDEKRLQEAMEADAAAEEAEGAEDAEGQEEAEGASGNEDATDADESQESEDSDEATDDAEPSGESASEDEEDKAPDKPVPVQAFLKQKAKWKARYAQAETRLKELEAKAASQGGGLNSQDAVAYAQYKGFIGKLQDSAKRFPWLANQLAALEQGIEPDWRAVHSALDAHVKALPNLDPTTAATLAKQQQVLDQLQFQARKQEFAERKVREDQTIRSMFKEAADERFFKRLNTVTAHLVKALPEGAFQLPDRTELAKELMAIQKEARESLLKEQTQVAKKKAGAGTPTMRGASAGAKPKVKIPAFGTPEYEAWMLEQIEADLKA